MIKSILYSAFSGITPLFRPQMYSGTWNIDPEFEPCYLKLHRSGELKSRGEQLWKHMESCDLCPRLCGVNKLRGLMIRHLVMPNNVSGTKEVVAWIAKNLPKDTYVNLMSQYRPEYKAFDYPEISRNITRQEYTEAINYAKAAGLTNLEIQGY